MYKQFIENLSWMGFFESLEGILNYYYQHPLISNSVLKFFLELVTNRGNRISLDSNSDMGTKLFKYIAKNVNAIGALLIKLENDHRNLPPNELYIRRYKPIALIIQIATNTIASKLVNFSVMMNYKDQDSLEFFEVMFTLIYITPQEEVTAYIKVPLGFNMLITQ